MFGNMPGLRDLIREIHRRSIWWALGAYIAVSWLVFEVIQQIAESADQPWLPNVALVLLLIGLPVVLGTALVKDRPVEDAGEQPSDLAVDGPVTTPTSAEPALASPGLFTARNTIVAVVLVAAVVFTVMNTGIWTIGGDAEVEVAVTPGDASVVVLPMDNIGGREDVAYLSEGITEQITAQLAKVSELRVISRTSAETVMGYNLTIPEIAERLGVEHVVEGSVQLFGEQIRVTAQLIHAATDDHLWADSYDGQLQDLFTLQEDIAIQVASALTSAVGGVREISSASRTEDPEAYEAYLIGKSQLHTRSTDGMLAAIESFERSIAQDPSYAPAYAGLAMTYGLFTGYGHPRLDGYELYGRGMEMANRAIELDEDAAEGYAARGYLGNRALAAAEPVETDFQRALELSPNSADVHGWYGHLLTRERRYDEGLAESEIGIQLDPLAPGRWVGQASDAVAARRYDLAARGAQQALALEPRLTSPRFYQGISHLLARRIDDCLNVLEGTFPGVQAMCHHSRGDEAEAMQTIDSLKTTLNSATDPQSHTEMMVYRDIAMFYAWIGNADESLTWLERAFSWSHDAVGSELIDSGIFDRVSQDPNFQSGLQRMQARIAERLRQILAR